jgi:4-hydroxy-3-polyprenylbenzoate decarboxylase
MARIVVGISGASGTILAVHLISALTSSGHFVEMVMSKDAVLTAKVELGDVYATPERFIDQFSKDQQSHIRLHGIHNFFAPIASGSFFFDACVVVPCSMATLAAISCGLSDTVLRRAADVALKERRKLIIVPRETPLNAIHLENMLKLAHMGVSFVPPMPAWYLHPKSVKDVELAIVSRILDQLGCPTDLAPRWG